MATSAPLYAYKETRLNLDSAVQSSTVTIRLPGTAASQKTSGQKRPHNADTAIAEDESAFKQRHLATSASVYHRVHHKAPRSFLWRILEDGKVLSIRAVDVSTPPNITDSNLTLRLGFPSSIRSSCIAFSDSSEHDTLSVFVLTESNVLYTLNFRPDHFRKQSTTEDGAGDWCKSYLSSAFRFKHPHRLVALSAESVLISLHDGGLLKLDKKPGSDGSEWRDTFYNEGGWGDGLRSLIPFHGKTTMLHEKISMELSAVTSISSPPTRINGVQYAFTVSLDHRLRIWNLQTGRIAHIGDILGLNTAPNDPNKPTIHPSFSQLVKAYQDNEASTLCVTYSPNGVGQFKFWDVTPVAGEDGLEVTDLFPDNILHPQAPSSDLWTLADFSVILNRKDINSFTLWTLWKNNTTYRVQKLEFQSGMEADVRESWRHSWQAMAPETIVRASLPSVFSGDSSDGTDKWLEYILFPGRYTKATIETGLAIYERSLGVTKDVSSKSSNLAERMCSIIASTATLGRTSEGQMDYAQFRAATDVQWRRFYRLLVELDKQRGEALSLVVDPQSGMPWVVSADGLSAIRGCSTIEQIWHNPDSSSANTEHVASLVSAAAGLRDSFSDQLTYNCNIALLSELYVEPSNVVPTRMKAFYDRCDLANLIGDEDYEQVVSSLGGNFHNVTPHVYEALLGTMNISEEIRKRDYISPLAEFGNKLVIRGVQEIVELHRGICLDQLILLVLIEAEINHGEEGIGFDTSSVFNQLILMLQRLELVGWLASTRISLPVVKAEKVLSGMDRSITSSKASTSFETITVLEGVMRHIYGLDTRNGESMSAALTEVIMQICAVDSEYEASPAVIQCFLLQNDAPGLAAEFGKFAGTDAFSTYIQGRVSLAVNDPLTAFTLFKKAAFGLAHSDPKKRTEYHSAGYLEETERNLLNAGLPRYYLHLVGLFDKDKNYSLVIDLAQLGLQFIKFNNEDLAPIRTEFLNRLFNATIQTSRYELAYSALTRFTDIALQHSSLRTLVIKMCESSHASELITLPLIEFQEIVDDILAQKCQSIMDVTHGVPYHKILYAWRIKRNDFRGAAAISFERLQRLQQAGNGDEVLGEDNLETPITRQFVTLINALSCVDPKQAWILAEEPLHAKTSNNSNKPTRRVVTLEQIRKSYQDELDRTAAIENNQFSFSADGALDVGAIEPAADEMDIL